MATESDEDCNSFIDEMEFDEDQPVLGPAQQTRSHQQFQSTVPVPQHKLSTVGASINVNGNRPVTQKNQTTQRDPLKHSLFHSFMLTQRSKRHVNVLHPETASHHSYLKSFRDQFEDAENQAGPNLNTQYRTATGNQVVSGSSARSRQQASILSGLAQQLSYQSQGDGQALGGGKDGQLMKQITVFSDGREGTNAQVGWLQSNLQKHMANTGQLLRSRSNTKRQNIESLAHNHSVGFINRPMMQHQLG
jgi:hypothetical protein